MANLIITIIAIALTAVAALMGAYYGGKAFLNAQLKAKATQYIQIGSQVASAVSAYVVNNAGAAMPAAAIGFGYLIPTYLSQSPSLPGGYDPSGYGVFPENSVSGSGGSGETPQNCVGICYALIYVQDVAICQEIESRAGNPSGIPSNDTDLVPPLPPHDQKFGCAIDNVGTLHYYFWYRVN